MTLETVEELREELARTARGVAAQNGVVISQANKIAELQRELAKARNGTGDSAELRALLEERYSLFGHEHWDKEMTRGANCPICIRQREWSEKVEAALKASPVASTSPTWIPLSERRPERTGYYLVSWRGTFDRTPRVCIAHFYREAGVSCAEWTANDTDLSPDAWMPQPAPYTRTVAGDSEA